MMAADSLSSAFPLSAGKSAEQEAKRASGIISRPTPEPTAGPIVGQDASLLRAEGLWAGYGASAGSVSGIGFREPEEGGPESERPGADCVLKEVSFSLGAGEIVGLLGPNGAGKSSLLLALSGILPLRRGRVLLQGRDVRAMKSRQRARSLAVMPQRLEFLPSFSLMELVLLGRYAHSDFLGNYRAHDYALAAETLERCGLSHLTDNALQRLSGGELQLGLLARALVQQTPLLLLDEATSSLDLRHRLNIFELLLERKARGAGILAAIHDLNLAALYCDRLIFLREGRIVRQGRTDELFTAEVLEEVYKVRAEIVFNSAGRPQALFNTGGWRV